ncbi:MAG: SusC/RagA family TonB-linked outer membrane protein, partial [Prolixibacteraceae bacterium]|nr:SusC/RagA family TonB-linked outer membrane protein [Prolixibacteraceae bacterium]
GFDINSAIDDNYNTGYPFSTLGTSLPTVPVYWPNGMPSSGVTAGSNPAVQASEESGYSKNIDKRYSAKASLDVVIPWVEGLGADGYFVYINNTGFDKSWSKPYLTNSYSHSTQSYSVVKGGPQTPTISETANNSSSTLTYFRVKYERRFNDHNINTFLAFEQSMGKSNYLSAGRRDFYSDVIDQIFAGGLDNQTTNGSASESARQNYFGRLNYGFKERYLLDINFRYDGSSNFPEDKRWGFFPGVSVGWRISEENFIRDNFNGIDNLKLRASYGQIGNDRVPSFQWLSTYALGSTTGYTFGRSPITTLGLTAGVTPNPSITWEVAEISNIGLDLDLWSGLLGMTLDAFKQRRSNILAKRDLAIPGNTGLKLPNENIGVVENKGLELELTHRRKVGDFNYSVGGNIAYSKNKIIDIDEATNIPEWQKREGGVLGAELLYRAVKIIRTQDELESIPVYPGTRVGDLQYEDVNDDGLISDADMVRVNQSSTPEITFGANLNLSYNRFSLWAHFSGQTRAWVQYHKYSKGAGHNSLKELLENRYTPGSMDSKYPIIPDSETRNMDINGFASTFWQMDASFLRLKSLELGYDIPGNLLSKIKINSMRVFLSGSNLFTIDKLKWYDPEGDRLIGDFYPQSKVYNLGLKISF